MTCVIVYPCPCDTSKEKKNSERGMKKQKLNPCHPENHSNIFSFGETKFLGPCIINPTALINRTWAITQHNCQPIRIASGRNVPPSKKWWNQFEATNVPTRRCCACTVALKLHHLYCLTDRAHGPPIHGDDPPDTPRPPPAPRRPRHRSPEVSIRYTMYLQHIW